MVPNRFMQSNKQKTKPQRRVGEQNDILLVRLMHTHFYSYTHEQHFGLVENKRGTEKIKLNQIQKLFQSLQQIVSKRTDFRSVSVQYVHCCCRCAGHDVTRRQTPDRTVSRSKVCRAVGSSGIIVNVNVFVVHVSAPQ